MSTVTWEKLIDSIDNGDVETARASLRLEADSVPDELSRAYTDQGLTVVIGAGVSKSCGVPSWPELLLKLHARSLESLKVKNVEQLTSAYMSAIEGVAPLVSARIAAANIGDDALKQSVRSLIYESNPAGSPLLKALARLCNCCEGEVGVRGVLTYNYDTLLEEELQQIGRRFDRKDRQDKGTGRGLPIRHVHGFLPRTPDLHEWIVLTEKQYHAEYSNPYTWSNVVQLNAFRETTCLFVGLSMSDPNLRRLLESSRATATPRHFALLRRTSSGALRDSIDASWESRGRPSDMENSRVNARLELLCDLADSNRKATLDELGVTVLWYTAHDQLDEMVKRIPGHGL